MKWFRLYDDVLDDAKVQQLDPKLFKNWINILCIASKNEPRGMLPSLEDLSFRLRLSMKNLTAVIAELEQTGLLDSIGESGLSPHNWTERQRSSDNVANRVRKHREKQLGNVTETLLARGPAPSFSDTDTDTDTDAANAAESAPRKPSGPAQELVAEYCRIAGIEKPANYSKAVGQAQALVKAGVTVQDMPSLFEAASWGDGADLGKMVNQFDRWRAAMNAPPRASPNGQKFLNGQRLLSSADLRRMAQEGRDHDQRGNDQTVIDPEFRVAKPTDH